MIFGESGGGRGSKQSRIWATKSSQRVQPGWERGVDRGVDRGVNIHNMGDKV